jgi:hypothetical protein
MNQRFLCSGCGQERGTDWAYEAHTIRGKKDDRVCGTFVPKDPVPAEAPSEAPPPPPAAKTFQTLFLETPKCDRCRQTLQTKDSLIDGRCALCRVGDARDAERIAVKATNPKDAVGIKKTPFWLVPATVVAEIALALLEGARKYGAYNWRVAGVRASVYVSATEGHMKDWWEGEDTDPESGLSHITKALASLTCLRDAMLQEMVEDDRPPKSKILPRQGNNARAAEIIERVRPNDPVPPYTEKDKVPR